MSTRAAVAWAALNLFWAAYNGFLALVVRPGTVWIVVECCSVVFNGGIALWILVDMRRRTDAVS